MHKQSLRRIPRILTLEYLLKSFGISGILLTRFKANILNFHTKLTVFPSSNLNQRFKANSKNTLVIYLRNLSRQPLLARWWLASALGDIEGVIIIDYLEKEKLLRDSVPYIRNKTIEWYRFGNNNEVICAVEEISEDQDTTFFLDWIVMLEHL